MVAWTMALPSWVVEAEESFLPVEEVAVEEEVAVPSFLLLPVMAVEEAVVEAAVAELLPGVVAEEAMPMQ